MENNKYNQMDPIIQYRNVLKNKNVLKMSLKN